jgi:hypothetical protein
MRRIATICQAMRGGVRRISVPTLDAGPVGGRVSPAAGCPPTSLRVTANNESTRPGLTVRLAQAAMVPASARAFESSRAPLNPPTCLACFNVHGRRMDRADARGPGLLAGEHGQARRGAATPSLSSQSPRAGVPVAPTDFCKLPGTNYLERNCGYTNRGSPAAGTSNERFGPGGSGRPGRGGRPA